MKITIDTALGGAGFVAITYVVTLVIAVIVAGLIALTCRLVHRKGKETPVNK